MELKFLTRESITEMKADDEKFIPMLISENRVLSIVLRKFLQTS